MQQKNNIVDRIKDIWNLLLHRHNRIRCPKIRPYEAHKDEMRVDLCPSMAYVLKGMLEKPPSCILAYTDDWEGLYVNGKLATQGHRISREEFAQITRGASAISRRVNEAWIEDCGDLPRSINDVQWAEE